jgi:hypothetical protein
MAQAKAELSTAGNAIDGLPRAWFKFDSGPDGCGMDQFSDTFIATFGSEIAVLIRRVRHFVIDHSLEKKGDDIVSVPYDAIVERNPGLHVHFDKILQVMGHPFKEFLDSLDESVINFGDPRSKQPDLP